MMSPSRGFPVAALGLVFALWSCGDDPGVPYGPSGPPLGAADAGTSGSLDAGAAPFDAGPPAFADAGGPPSSSACATAFEAEVIRLANDARRSTGAPSLECAEDLAAVARAHSRDMCDRGYFSHTDLSGRSPFDRMRAAGVDFLAAGENIAQGQSSPARVHDAWMGSSGHRRNILRDVFGRIGVGYVECGGSRRHYWTQIFAD